MRGMAEGDDDKELEGPWDCSWRASPKRMVVNWEEAIQLVWKNIF